MKRLIGILLCVSMVLYFGVMIYKSINYDIEIGGHLKRAADANTTLLAKQEMKTALQVIEARGMIKGYTSIIYNTPDEDVGFWYENLKQSLMELEKVTATTTQLEQSNILMKLRETLLDTKETGDNVTEPQGISLFPNNIAYAIWGLVSGLMLFIGLIFVASKRDGF